MSLPTRSGHASCIGDWSSYVCSSEIGGPRAVGGDEVPQEIIALLVETYRPGLDELWCLLAGRRPPGEPIPASLQSKAPLLRPWPWLLDELARMHAEVQRTLAAVPPDLRPAAPAPLVMLAHVKDAQRTT